MKKDLSEHPFLKNNEFVIAFQDFLAMRRKMKHPTTARAENLLLKTADKLSKGDVEIALRIVDQSIEHGWLGFYPLKNY